ncbi:MAG: haloacid dehalogenase [Thermoprotei archaeon]|nr:MAG: haloacid dehalogenase [Thermoprotei archaeon]RLE96579.1 MAG: haloacid dehalogenase [Thermoprotei archaeon]
MRLSEIIERARVMLEEEDEVREDLLKLTREVGREARRAVFKVHEGDLGGAEERLKTAREAVQKILCYKERYPRLYYSGSTSAALAEYVEACLLLAYAKGSELPGFEELEVEPHHYLLGLADFVGELRRLMVRYISSDKYGEAGRALRVMEEVYKGLLTISVPDALVPGLRRKVDVLRGVVESAARDLLYYVKSGELSRALRELLAELAKRRGS